MTDFRFDPAQLRNHNLNRRKATLRILTRLGFSPAEIARIDGKCTAWDIVEYQLYVKRCRTRLTAIATGEI
ncbi:MAG: hypothetical protein JKY00_06685 [Roseicyclus sp.]|nr:hypothetical protein [Roseicyclus sp.]